MPDPLVSPAIPISDSRVKRAINLAWYEADLLDHKEYATWKDLYHQEGYYVIPLDATATDFANTLNMVYDDAHMRDLRVVRMTEGHAIAAVDAATTVRTISRFVPQSVDDSEVSLRAAQILIAYKRGRHDIWAGEVEFTVRLGTEPAADRILLKVVRLVDADAATPAAGFLL
jgi:3-phenylpropionate/cinnamic acid dioxygenase small subunit